MSAQVDSKPEREKTASATVATAQVERREAPPRGEAAHVLRGTLSPLARVFSSVWLAVFLLLALGIIVGLGSVFGLRDDVVVWGKSTWYAVLLLLLGLNILGATLTRWPFKLHHIPWLCVHVGVEIILLGAILTSLFHVEGQVMLVEGRSTSTLVLTSKRITVIRPVPDAGDARQARAVANVVTAARQGLVRSEELQSFLEMNGVPYRKEVIRPPLDGLGREEDLGLRYRLAEGLEVRVHKLYPHFVERADVRAAASGPPAARVRFSSEHADGEEMWLVAGDPERSALSLASFGGQRVEVGLASGISVSNEGALPFVVARAGGPPETQLLRAGEAISLGAAHAARLEVLEVIDRAMIVRTGESTTDSDRGDAVQIQVAARAAEGGGDADSETAWLPIGPARAFLAGDNGGGDDRGAGAAPVIVELSFDTRALPFEIGLDEFAIQYYPGTEQPREFESTVSVSDPSAERSREGVRISMNNPLHHGGLEIGPIALGEWVFFQSSYQSPSTRNGPWMSVFSVSRDPGKWPFYVGSGVLVTGLMLIFYVKPWLVRVESRRLAARALAARAAAAGEAKAKAKANAKEER